MTVLEYIQQLNRAKQTASDRFSGLSVLERAVVEGSYEWLIDNLDLQRGNVVVNDDLTETMNRFLDAVVGIINENNNFKGKVSSFLSDLSTIQANNKKFHSTFNHLDIEKAGVTTVQKAVVEEVLQQFAGNGLNAGFVTPLRDGIFHNILLGSSIKDVKQVLQTYIISGEDTTGKLQSYLHNTAIQAVDTYTGAINQKLVQEFTFTGYIISGSLINTSSVQCIKAVEESDKTGGYLPFSEWKKILEIARHNKKAKLIEGTTIETLPLNKLHWGCRHDFTPVIM